MKAILIGFEYSGEKKLPGIIIDLYLAYKFLKNNEFDDVDISIITDIRSDLKTDMLRTAILEETVHSDILSFIEDSKDKNIYTQYSSLGYYNNFESVIKTESEYTLVYYTGHSENGNIILPDYSLYSLDNFRDLYKNTKQCLVILDCCESNGLNLPYLLTDNVYRLESELFIKSNMICISSSLSHQDSIASITGSFFTRYIFNLLKHKNKSLQEILDDINLLLNRFSRKYNTKQTVNIYASNPSIKWIFGFVYNHPPIEIIYDSICKSVEITL